VVTAVKTSVRQSVLSSSERKRKADAQHQHELIASIVRPKNNAASPTKSTKLAKDAMNDEQNDKNVSMSSLKTTPVQSQHLTASLSTLVNYADSSSDSD